MIPFGRVPAAWEIVYISISVSMKAHHDTFHTIPYRGIT